MTNQPAPRPNHRVAGVRASAQQKSEGFETLAWRCLFNQLNRVANFRPRHSIGIENYDLPASVMIRRKLKTWKKFIRGRIAPEEGRKEDTLRKFEQAIGPNNRYFRDANNVAHNTSSGNPSSREEHLVVRVQQGYERLAEIVASQQDEPMEGLKRILAELKGRTPFDGYVKTYNGGLHW